jgi:hypothetical protein
MKKVAFSQTQKIALIIGGGVLSAFVLKRIYRAITNKGQASSINTNEAPPPTRPPGYFNLAADAIEKAVFDVGTDEDSIFRVFADLNGDGDFVALFNAYGIRRYFSFSTLFVDLNLTQTLQEELTRTEITELNNLLASRNITYRI